MCFQSRLLKMCYMWVMFKGSLCLLLAEQRKMIKNNQRLKSGCIRVYLVSKILVPVNADQETSPYLT